MKKLQTLLKCSLAIVVAAMCLALFVPQAKMETEAATLGIDVSSYQGAINWQAVKGSGVQYAMIRVGNTAYGMDSYFAQNMIGANAAGLRVGVYCYTYATNVAEAVAEAQFVLAAVAPYTVSFPIAIDIEDQVHHGLNATQQAEIVNAFCSTIYNAGYTPMVYASRNWFLTRMAPVAWDHWVAQYNTYCDYPGYTMWQSSSSGSFPGIAGRVDVDYLNKDYFSLIIANGFTNRNGKTYYYQNYKQVVGLQTINNKMYFFDATGAMMKGWLGTGAAKYYFTSDGSAAMGWQSIEGGKYYFGANGLASVGLTAIDGFNYLFDANGLLVTGWLNNGGVMNYYAADGKMATGLTTIDGATYYFGPDGAMAVGLTSTPTGTYNFGTDGKMLTGWQVIGTGYYYFGADGILVTNAVFNDNAGITVQVDANGLLVVPEAYVPQ